MDHFLSTKKHPTILLSVLLLLTTGCDWFDSDSTDTTAPEISLVGANPQMIEMGRSYTELGATATDDRDGDISNNIIIDATSVDTAMVGEYSVNYNVTDTAGNQAVTQIRNVRVVADLTPPELTLSGDNPQTVEANDPYLELGAVAIDNIDGDITDQIVIDATGVDSGTVGSYSVSYNISDAAGNAIEQTRLVNVVDTTPPTIDLLGANPQTVEIDVAYNELGATAVDNLDGDISANIQIDASLVDTSTIGSYEVTYDVSDTAGNEAATLTRLVNVVEAPGEALTFIVADDGVNGYELYLTDGTDAGTVMVKDINPNGGSRPQELLNINGILYFSADNGESGRELWKSDGTADGTIMLKDINSSGNSYPRYFCELNGVLYFTANADNGLEQLWISDGSEAGTTTVKSAAANYTSVRYITAVGDTLYFSAGTNDTGRELWKSDGTDSGTVQIADIYAGSSSSSPSDLINFNGMLYFTAQNGVNGYELWKSDGTQAGTSLVKDIRTGDASFSASPNYKAVMNGVLYFAASDDSSDRELWKSDGTDAGTVLVANINPTGNSHPIYMTDVDGVLFFTAEGSSSLSTELWKSDGSSAGTVLVKDINTNGGSGPSSFINLNGVLIFRANDSNNETELWKSDGTESGTVMVHNINPGGDSNADPLTYFNTDYAPIILPDGRLIFGAYNVDTGLEPWVTDGTESGTIIVKDVNPGTANGFFENSQ